MNIKSAYLKTLIIYLLGTFIPSVYAKDIPHSIKQSYTSGFYKAFEIQSFGKSTLAYCQFSQSIEEAKNAGESISKINLIEQLFSWYRLYGTHLNLYNLPPTGRDKIIGEYIATNPQNHKSNYQSQFGNSPEQSAIVRDFMLGVAETISGVFCVAVSSGIASYLGGGLAVDGSKRMYTSLSSLWANHERALLDLKKLEEEARIIMKKSN